MTEAESRADRAAETGDLATAIRLLDGETQIRPDDGQLWLKLAALRRASGQPAKALDAVNKALQFAELDFMALTMKATLLDQVAPAQAGQAWGYVLAQLPAQPLPPQVEAVIERGRLVHAQWLRGNRQRLDAAVGPLLDNATADEKAKIERFTSNVLRETRVFHSEPTHFAYPGLVEREFHPRADHPWLEELEAAVDDFADELANVMAAERAELVPYIEYEDHEPLAQWRQLNKNPDWTAVHLIRNGERVEANARHCPKVMEMIARIPQPDIPGAGPNAMFSLLAPNTVIPPHVGVNNARLVCHLPLIIPEGCWFRVGAETRYWKRGEAFVFDDTIEHEAANPSNDLRVVFILDVWHPGLSELDREAVRQIIMSEGAAGGGL